MFENIGGRIKTLAICVFLIEVIATILTPIILMTRDIVEWYVGLLIIFCGVFVAFFFFTLIYGFGHLVENSEILATDTLAKNSELRNIFDRDQVLPEITSTEKIKEMRQKKKKQERAAERKAKSQTPDNLSDGENDEEEYYDVVCAKCKQLLSYTKEEIMGDEQMYCPMCNSPISFD
jgi:DNA-directed RNA polymerase subunit RPC12/RpoP